jgi:hypothetical protein
VVDLLSDRSTLCITSRTNRANGWQKVGEAEIAQLVFVSPLVWIERLELKVQTHIKLKLDDCGAEEL